MTDHDDCVPRAALLRLAEEMEAYAVRHDRQCDSILDDCTRTPRSVADAARALTRASDARLWLDQLRSVAGLPPRAPTVDLTKEGP